MSEDYRSYSLAIAQERIKALEVENAKMKAALNKIYHYIKDPWQDYYCVVDSARLFTYLKEGGVEIPCGEKE